MKPAIPKPNAKPVPPSPPTTTAKPGTKAPEPPASRASPSSPGTMKNPPATPNNVPKPDSSKSSATSSPSTTKSSQTLPNSPATPTPNVGVVTSPTSPTPPAKKQTLIPNSPAPTKKSKPPEPLIEATFSEGTYVFIPDNESCFLPAKVKKTFKQGDDFAEVEELYEKKTTLTLSSAQTKECVLMDLQSLDPLDNMVEFRVLNEASLLHNLRIRYLQDEKKLRMIC